MLRFIVFSAIVVLGTCRISDIFLIPVFIRAPFLIYLFEFKTELMYELSQECFRNKDNRIKKFIRSKVEKHVLPGLFSRNISNMVQKQANKID